ncbi:chitin synthase [Powellomyces hirtus]|uniref:chitin synthase n=1 Tax=Powellomyces hirtus TaxID=109895 RepID=A0A507DXM9_9FUNG|nr:chitin synthase [Powellomyces hirtus]
MESSSSSAPTNLAHHDHDDDYPHSYGVSETTPLANTRPSLETYPHDYSQDPHLNIPPSSFAAAPTFSKRTSSMYDDATSAYQASYMQRQQQQQQSMSPNSQRKQRQRYSQAAYPVPQQYGSDLGAGSSSAVSGDMDASTQQYMNPPAPGHNTSGSTLLDVHGGYDGHVDPASMSTVAAQDEQYYDNISTYYAQSSVIRGHSPQPPMQQQRMQQPMPGPMHNPMQQPGPGPGPGPQGQHQYGYTNPYGYNFNYNQAYPPPQGLSRHRGPGTIFRHKTKKTVQLTAQGNFVVEIAVPAKVVELGKHMNGREFTHLRYTAACGDPNDFAKRGYNLRAAELGRHTELFVVMTMYNEDEILFTKTWKAVMKNIAHLCQKKRSSMWGHDGWQKVVVCVVSDGRTKINPRTLNVLGVMGCYQEGVVKTSINEEEVAAHLFEFTTQVCVDPDLNVRGSGTGLVPVQVIFCLKEKNAKKINSHRWFFNAFGRCLRPNVCVLLDVGTKPTDRSLYRLWKAFDSDRQVAGACGEIAAETGNYGQKLLNPLVAAQNFEYKMSNILDKPLESVFGFIAVLPGAFSAYRYAALQNGADGTGPLEKYFLGERMHGSHGDVKLSQANMYLAEDRILCFELVTKRDENWILKYVKDAKAETDVPDSIAEFISQRRRWLNGSFFAGIHAISHFYQIFRSGHSFARSTGILILLFYNFINVIFNWFSLANFYLIFYFLSSGMVADPDTDPFFGAGPVIVLVVKQVYIFSIATIFVASLGNRPQGSRLLYLFCFTLFACIMTLMLYMAGFAIALQVKDAISATRGVNPDGTTRTDTSKLPSLIEKAAFRDLVLSTASTYGSYFIASIAYLDPWHMFNSFIQYLLFLPGFINILMVYAFGNLHDVSWGTKGDNAAADVAPVTVKKDDKSGNKVATVDLPVHQSDIDASYDQMLRALPPPVKLAGNGGDTRSDKLKQEDYFRLFRTRVVLLWILCNVGLVAVLTTEAVAEKLGVFAGDRDDVGKGNTYLTFTLWSVAALSLFRFVGSMIYLCTNGEARRQEDRNRTRNV